MKKGMFFCLAVCSLFFINGSNAQATEDFSLDNREEIINDFEEELSEAEENIIQGTTLSEQEAPSIVANLMFRVIFESDIPIMNLFDDLKIKENPEIDSVDWYAKNWYEKLENTSDRTITTTETYRKENGEEVSNPITLRGRYIDNGSDKTVILHHGYRALKYELIKQAKFFSEEGFNVLLISSRAVNGSDGKYITFGYYEKDDLNMWINDEVNRTNSDQKIVLMGVSMGASTTVLSQNVPHPNVVAYIEDCGYADLHEEMLQAFSWFSELLPIIKNVDFKQLVNQISQRTESRLGFSIDQISPIESAKNTDVPKLFIHGGADDFIPISHMEDMYNASPGYKEKLVVDGAIHGKSFDTNPEIYTEGLRHFLNNVFQ
ncbi:alpha/beta hydrolase [Enterococcus alishanensis]